MPYLDTTYDTQEPSLQSDRFASETQIIIDNGREQHVRLMRVSEAAQGIIEIEHCSSSDIFYRNIERGYSL